LPKSQVSVWKFWLSTADTSNSTDECSGVAEFSQHPSP